MKAKTQRKKPALNKKTIANLNGKQMKKVPGGQDEDTKLPGYTRCTCTPTGVPGCPNCVSV